MTHGIEKETYVNADEATTKALTFDLLTDLRSQLEILNHHHAKHMNDCNDRFRKIENHDKRNRVIAGFLGGAAVALIQWLRKIL